MSADAYDRREALGQDVLDYDPLPDWDFEPANVLGVPVCPVCDGPGFLLGQLGRLLHFRCRDCGIDFHTKEDTNG